MNSDQPQGDVPGLDEDLVAYLDGELDDTTSKRLEERLSNDETARQRLRALAVSWDLLDHLPRAATDESFTRTTVELIAVEARKDVDAEEAAIPSRNRRRWIGGLIAGLAAAMIGFVAVVVAWPDENERLLRDLPVVQNYELYDVTPESGAIDFLRSLEKTNWFVGEAVEGDAKADSHNESGALSPEVLAARRSLVQSLSPEKKTDLRKLYERFKAETKEEQERFRKLDIDLRASADEAQLRAVLASYHNWLPTLSPLERANLLKMPADKAIEEIQRLKKEQLRMFARSGGSRQGPLSPSDVDRIERWTQDWAMKQKDEILARATPEQQTWFANLPEDLKRRSLVFLSREPGRPKAPELNDKEWQDLLSLLPTVKVLFENQGKAAADKVLQPFPFEMQENIKSAVSKANTAEEKRNLLFGWFHSAQWARDAFAGGVSRQELDRFIREDLNEKERSELLSQPPEEFQKRLRFLYHVKKELPPGHFRGFGKRGFGRGEKGEGRGPGEGFGPGRRGGPPGFNRDRNERHDQQGRPERNEDRGRRRGPEPDDKSNGSSERDESANNGD